MKRLVYAADGLSSKERIKIAKQTTNPRELLRLAHDKSRLVREAVAQNEAITEQVAEALIDEGVKGFNVASKKALIENFPDIFNQLFVDDENSPVRRKVAEKTNDSELLAKLADDEAEWVRVAVAGKTNDSKLLGKLADDESVNVRAAVAEKTNDPELLAKFSDDENTAVREAVAKKTDNPKLLAKLVDDENWIVRRAVARSTNDPRFLEKFADDDDLNVREAVAEKTSDLKLLAKLADDEDWIVRKAVARNTDDLQLLAKFADDKNHAVRLEVVEKTSDPELLAKFAGDKNWIVRLKIVEKIDDPKLLAKFADDVDFNVRSTARRKLKISNRNSSKSKKPTQTEWSIPLFELENYSSIEQEIDTVLKDSINAAMKQAFPNISFSYEVTANSYDDDGELIITAHFDDGVDETYNFDLQRVLAIATSSQKKKECIKKTANFLVRNIS